MVHLAAAVLLIVSAFTLNCRASDNTASIVEHEKRLYRVLLGDSYNKDIRPTAKENDTVIVKLGMAIINVNYVDEKHGSINVQSWMRMLWTDQQLKWDPSDYGGVKELLMPHTKIWRPDITLFNSASQQEMFSENTKMAIVYSTGDVLWIPPMRLHAKCDLDMSNFPFDTQSCPFRFGSWVYDGLQVDLQHYAVLGGIDFSHSYHHIEWEFKESSAVYKKRYYPCCEAPYPDITYTLVMKRRTTYYSYMYIAPPLLASFLLPLIFVLPSLHVSRYFLAVGLLIIMYLLTDQIGWVFPTVDGTIPLLGRYYIGVFVLSFLALVFSALITTQAYQSRSGRHPSGFVKKVIIDGLGRLLCVSPGGYSSAASGDDSEDKLDAGGNSGDAMTEWLRLGQVLDRLMILFYIILTLLIALIYVTR